VKSLVVEIAAPGRVVVVEDDFEEPGAGEVMFRSLYSGISAGTEGLIYRGEFPAGVPLDETLPSLGARLSYPVRYGYSCAGLVERAGSGLFFAFHPHQQRFVIAADQLVALPGTPARLATLFPLVETALQVALEAGRVAHEHVVVTGLGAVGILIGGVLGMAGAHIVGVDPLPWRRQAAARFGIEAVVPEGVKEVVANRTDGRGTPLVVEASGNPQALATCLSLLGHEGTALVVSWYGIKPASLPLGLDFHRRRLTIRSTQVSSIPARLAGEWTVPRRRAVAADLMRKLPLEVLATHEFPLEDAPAAFEAVASGERGLIHAALRYD
jgi:2-desacetyl-2-hydroxyethyl bacteriochlorophyllide A dehydrogenase